MSDASSMELSNWGRWGADDQRGTLNLLTPDVIKQAAGLIKTGKTYSLAMPLAADGPQYPTRHKTWKVTSHRGYSNVGVGASDDVVTMHSHSGTHMDALSHFWKDGQMYNGHPISEHVSTAGVTRNSIDNVGFIVGRAVLLDIAAWKGVDHLALGEAITAADLEACAAAQNVTIHSSDILLIRTGWIRVFATDRALFDSGEPGIDETTLPWLKEHDIVAIGADNHAVEVIQQIPPAHLPVHVQGIRDMGLYLMEYFNLEQLAADKAYESFLVVAPLPLTAGVGSPINPIAIT